LKYCKKSCGVCQALCVDNYEKECKDWVADGYCEKSAEYMVKLCPKSCNMCPKEKLQIVSTKLTSWSPALVQLECRRTGCKWTDDYACPWEKKAGKKGYAEQSQTGKKGTIAHYACCESRIDTKQPCGASDLECEFKPIPKSECPCGGTFTAKGPSGCEQLPVCHGLLEQGVMCRANNVDKDAHFIVNSEKVNNCAYGFDVFRLECTAPVKNWHGVLRTGDSKCVGRTGLTGSCAISNILDNTMEKFQVPDTIKTVVTKGIELATTLAGDNAEAIDNAICLGDWSLKDWETSKAEEGYGLSENGCGAVLAAGDTGSVTGLALKWPAFVEEAPEPDICFTHNVCDGSNSFAIGVGPGSTSMLLTAIGGLGAVFDKIGEVSLSVGFSAGGHYRTAIDYYNGQDDVKEELNAQLYTLTKANTVNFAKQMCDSMMGEEDDADGADSADGDDKKSKKKKKEDSDDASGAEEEDEEEGALEKILGCNPQGTLPEMLCSCAEAYDPIQIEAEASFHFAFAGTMDDIKACLFSENPKKAKKKKCNPKKIIADAGFVSQMKGVLTVKLSNFGGVLPDLTAEAHAQIYKNKEGLYFQMGVNIMKSLTALCNKLANMIIAVSCPELSMALHLWVTTKEIGFKFQISNVFGFIQCAYIYADNILACKYQNGNFVASMPKISFGRRMLFAPGLTAKEEAEARLAYQQDPENWIYMQTTEYAGNTGIVFDAGENTSEFKYEPIVNGHFATREELEEFVKGDYNAEHIVEDLENTVGKEVIDKAVKEGIRRRERRQLQD